MRKVNKENVPQEVLKALDIFNTFGKKWISTNSVTYYPNGDNPNRDDNKAVVYHQLENGEYAIIRTYKF